MSLRVRRDHWMSRPTLSPTEKMPDALQVTRHGRGIKRPRALMSESSEEDSEREDNQGKIQSGPRSHSVLSKRFKRMRLSGPETLPEQRNSETTLELLSSDDDSDEELPLTRYGW